MPFLNTLLDIIFPLRCLSCGEKGEDLCSNCMYNFPEAERESAKWIFPLFDYRHPPLKKSLWLLKYKGKKRLAKVLAESMYAKILEELSELGLMENFRAPLLIPIPLSPKRYRERGYNQAELICKELINLSMNNLTPPSAPLSLNPLASPLSGGNNLPPLIRGGQEGLRGARGEVFTLETNILIKTKETKHQAHIHNRSERLKNLQGSFTIRNEALIQNRNIILIDDITTTGATLGEARKILKNFGAKKIIAFTVAH